MLDSTDPDSTVLYENTRVSVRVTAGALTAQTLTTDSLRVAQQADFTFHFTVTNPVPPGGQIEISFPLSHFEVPS